jgi:hypothetical protein
MKICLRLSAILLFAACALAEPKVVVLPFDPVMDSLYGYLGGKESILNYRKALQEMLTLDLSKHTEIRVIELSDLKRYIADKKLAVDEFNNPALAAGIAGDLGADYAIIGIYGEYSREIRVDARVVIAATSEVPPGHTVTASVGLWDDLPTAASQLAIAIVPIVTASGRMRPVSKGILYPEGDLSAYDQTGKLPKDQSRLVIWVNAPVPEFISTPPVTFTRCERVDLMDAPMVKQQSETCKFAVLSGGRLSLKVIHRGYLPYAEELNLAPGKAYRLEINLKPVDVPQR